MEPLYILIIVIILLGVVGYFITYGLFRLMEFIVAKTKGGLPGVFVFIVLTSCVYVSMHKDSAAKYLQDLQFWNTEKSPAHPDNVSDHLGDWRDLLQL